MEGSEDWSGFFNNESQQIHDRYFRVKEESIGRLIAPRQRQRETNGKQGMRDLRSPISVEIILS